MKVFSMGPNLGAGVAAGAPAAGVAGTAPGAAGAPGAGACAKAEAVRKVQAAVIARERSGSWRDGVFIRIRQYPPRSHVVRKPDSFVAGCFTATDGINTSNRAF